MSLLDIGAGAGTITADFAGRVRAVTATDLDPGIVARLRASLGNEVDCLVADAHRLPFADNSFDIVHAHQVLQHLSAPVMALREMRRVAKPGGLIAVRDSDYAAFYWYPESAELTRWRDLYRELARRAGGEPDAGRYFLAWARAAGLDDVEVGAETWCFATPEDRAWWCATWADRVQYSAFAEQARAIRYSDETLAWIADGWRSWAIHEDGYFVVPHGYLLARA